MTNRRGDHRPALVFHGRNADEAIAVARGAIVALGSDALDRATSAAAGIDIGDGTLVPAFRDGHLHPLWGGYWRLGPPIAGSSSVDDLLRRVADHARAHPELRWITAAGYDPAQLPGGLGPPGRLDQAVDDRPVLLWAADHHSAWANSAALARAGVTAATRDPDGGRFVRDAHGTPTGALLEAAAQAVAAHSPRPTGADRERGLRLALAEMVSAGIVWGLDASVVPSDVPVYARLAAAGELPCRIGLALKVDPDRWRDQRADFVAIRADVGTGPGRGLSVTSVKFFLDGIVEAGTAALIEPYHDDPGSHGIANWDRAELAAAVAAFDADGFGLHFHAIGDAAVRAGLDAIECADRVNGRRDRRAVIAHVQLVQPGDLARFARLGVVANFEPLWAQRDRVMTELTEPRLGQPRSTWQYPIGSLDRLGARISFGSDWPVSSMRPLEGIAVAVSRQTPAGDPPGGWLPDQRLSIDRALDAYTTGVAYQAFEDSVAGRLAVGQRADLCLLSADPRTAPASDLAQMAVLGTWSAGNEVFRA